MQNARPGQSILESRAIPKRAPHQGFPSKLNGSKTPRRLALSDCLADAKSRPSKSPAGQTVIKEVLHFPSHRPALSG